MSIFYFIFSLRLNTLIARLTCPITIWRAFRNTRNLYQMLSVAGTEWSKAPIGWFQAPAFAELRIYLLWFWGVNLFNWETVASVIFCGDGMFGVETGGRRTAWVCIGLSPVLVVTELPERVDPGAVWPVWSPLQVGLTVGEGNSARHQEQLGFWVWYRHGMGFHTPRFTAVPANSNYFKGMSVEGWISHCWCISQWRPPHQWRPPVTPTFIYFVWLFRVNIIWACGGSCRSTPKFHGSTIKCHVSFVMLVWSLCMSNSF